MEYQISRAAGFSAKLSTLSDSLQNKLISVAHRGVITKGARPHTRTCTCQTIEQARRRLASRQALSRVRSHVFVAENAC